MQLTTGKIRQLQQCATPERKLVIMAIDHRGSLRRSLNPQDPAAAPDEVLVTFKQDVTAALAPAASAVLLDPEYGAEPCIASGTLPGTTGLIVALERTGYTGDPAARVSELLSDWNPQRALQLGASGVVVGRAVWHGATEQPAAEQVEFLRTVARARMACIDALCRALAHPWHTRR